MSDLFGTGVAVGDNTYVSSPGLGGAQATITAGAGGAPNGGSAPGAQMPMTAAVLVPLALSVGGLGVLYWIFRKEGAGLPPLRIDAAEIIKITFAAEVGRITLNLLAYHYHAHKLAQAWLLVG